MSTIHTIASQPVYEQFMPTPARGLTELWVPAGVNVRERIYFPAPDFWSNTAKAVRFQMAPSTGVADAIPVLTILDTTITLVNKDGQEFMSSVPLRRLYIGAMGATGQMRGLPIYHPQDWDPLRSFIQVWKGFATPARVQLLVDYIDPRQ